MPPFRTRLDAAMDGGSSATMTSPFERGKIGAVIIECRTGRFD